MSDPQRGDADERERRRRRRRFAAQLAPAVAVLLAVGVLFADEAGAPGTLRLVALAQGIGLVVALLWLAAGHNALSRR